MKVQANVPCCICHSSDSEELFAAEFQNHKYPGLFHIRKCNGCGLFFNSPRLPENEFPELYQESYYFHKRSNKKEFERILKMYSRTVALVSEDIKNKKVLEIGSAKGYLLAVMKRLGWEVQGLELSIDAANFAREKLKVPTEQGELEDYVKKSRFGNENFPLILAIDLIEHVLYPEPFVENISHILADDGIFIIDTPNGNAANIIFQGAEWNGFNPYHIFIFSLENLTQLLSKHGLVVQKAFTYGNYNLNPNNSGEKMTSAEKPSSFNPKENVKSMLKKSGLFNLGISVYKLYENAVDNLCSIHINKVCRQIKEGKTYFQTPDSEGPHAKQCRGNKLVIIAKKKLNR